MDTLPDALSCMGAYAQFIVYKATPNPKKPGKTIKKPADITGKTSNAHEQGNWYDFATVSKAANALGPAYGVGFVFTPADPFFFLDIDDCVVNGDWSDLSKELMQTFHGAAVEVSQSGSGLHIIGCYDTVEPAHACKNIPLGLELYTSDRFVALTGKHASGNAAVNHVAALYATINDYFPHDIGTGKNADSVEWADTFSPESNPIRDDEKLLKKALSSKTAFGVFGGGNDKATFKDLWTKNVEKLSRAYPDEDRDYNESSADRALAQHLAFWTGNNPVRIERLMWASGLVRDKWTEHKSYIYRTVVSAVGSQTKFYDFNLPANLELPKSQLVPESTAVPAPIIKTGSQTMGVTQQIDFFKGCVYVTELHRAFLPSGLVLKPESFNVVFGGYNFIMDNDDGMSNSKKAWECFTESQAVTFPKVDGFCFNPNIPSGEIVHNEGHSYVNTYVPLDIRTIKGDASPFLNHLTKLLPDERDRTILLSFLAAVVQYKGFKIQWAPLIQGVEGNGKTLFSRCLTYAVGDVYTHQPPASEIAEKFNSWLFDKLLICVEDIFISHHRQEVLETLKPMITSDRLARRAMQQDQTMHDVCANFIFNSNHKDAIRTNLNDRRYCVFFTAQQEAEDIIRDGMGGDYFPNLYRWLKADGYAIVADYLNNFAIPDEFNPTMNCQRAPMTTSTLEAVEASLGPVEQQIIANNEAMLMHFKGDWVSSYGLNKMFKENNKLFVVPSRSRRKLMKSLGYIPHPHLHNGRAPNPMMTEGNSAPILYIKATSHHTYLTEPPAIIAQYQTDQGVMI